MELPFELKNAIEENIKNINIKQLQGDAEKISYRYRNESGKGKRLLTENTEAVSYSIVRMPATYSAIATVLKHTFDLCDFKIESMLDVGAGTGAGSWAVINSLPDINKITCFEREEAMIKLGKSLMSSSEIDILKNCEWKKVDLINGEINEQADLVICSYVLNEMEEENRNIILEKLWKCTNKVLIIIEPGTPVGFDEIKKLRTKLIEMNGNVIAPCPNNGECLIQDGDWCHSTCRVSRSKIHKLLKNGDVPYEDEKFSYISVCKENNEKTQINKQCFARVLRHPKIESGKISLRICSNDGIKDISITKKDKEKFKIARKLNCGDAFLD